MHLANGVGDGRRCNNGSDAPAGYAERLGRAADGDRPVVHVGKRRNRDVLTVVEDVLVDLIRHGVRVVLVTQLGDALQLLP